MRKSKSARRKKKKLKFIQKLKQPWWPVRKRLELLPSDLMLNILQRVPVTDRLKNAQRVCTAWHKIYMNPSLWRVVHINEDVENQYGVPKEVCKQIVDRSQGQLLDLAIVSLCDQDLLQYIAERSSQLRRLQFVYNIYSWHGGIFSEAFKKLSLLEELSFVNAKVHVEYIEAVGRYCPLLKTLKLNKEYVLYNHIISSNEIALAIGKNLPGLTHLELIGSDLENIGLQAILDGCCHLESLDLRQCYYLDLKTDLRKRCYSQIKHLKLPHHSLKGYLRAYGIVDDSEDGYSDDGVGSDEHKDDDDEGGDVLE